jgi:hypothetical protein
MAKGETRKVNDQLNSQLGQENENTTGFANNAINEYSAMKGGYSSSPSFNAYGALAGGYNPNIQGLENIGKTGAMSPEALAALGGNGVYSNFAATGGYSPKDIANMRARGTSEIPSMYGALKQQLARGNVSSGGYNTGFGSQMAKLTRQEGQSAQDAALNTELGIKQQVNQNKLAGASGLQNQGQAMNQASLAGYGGALGGQEFGISGMSQQEQAMLDRILSAYGLQSGAANNTLATRAQLNPNHNWMTDVLGAGAAVGAAAV